MSELSRNLQHKAAKTSPDGRHFERLVSIYWRNSSGTQWSASLGRRNARPYSLTRLVQPGNVRGGSCTAHQNKPIKLDASDVSGQAAICVASWLRRVHGQL